MIQTNLDNLRTLSQIAEQQGLSIVAREGFIAYDRARTMRTVDPERLASIMGELIRQLEQAHCGATLSALESNQ